MKPWFAGILAVAGLFGSAAVQAASPDCSVQGGTLLSWPADGKPVWEMCWLGPGQSVGPRGSGLELRAVHYNGILVAKKIHSPLLFAEYTHGTCYRDWMNDDSPVLANTATHNQLGTPPDAARLAITSCSVSRHPTQAFGTCSFGQTPQAGEACTTGENVVIGNMGDHVTLVANYRADWYMYDSRISFHANGDIEPTFGFGNINGTENATTHWHHNYWRFDFDIDEPGNNMLAINDVDQVTDFSDVRGAPGTKNWSVRNTVSGRGYRMIPGANDYEVTPNQSGLGHHTVDVVGTRYNAAELGDGGNPNNLGDCRMHVDNMVTGQSIENTDVVLFYHGAVRDSTANNWPAGCSGSSCIPQDSMICKSAGPRLVPFGDWSSGTNHVVTANPDMTFTPRNLTINEGDTVTFQNAGGFHNVVATSGPTTFRCANGCDGAGGNGNLSNANWSATVTFPTAGQLTYFCEAHGSAAGSGMAGTITILGKAKRSADLALTLVSTPDPVLSGEEVNLTATVSNAGPDEATGVSVIVTLPQALSYQSAGPAGWACTNTNGVVSCALSAAIASGANAPALNLVAVATGSGIVNVDAEVGSDQDDADANNNAATLPVEIIADSGDDVIFADGFEKGGGPVECKPLQLLQDTSFEATTSDAGANAFWTGVDSNSSSGGTPFWGDAARTGSRGVWGGGWGEASTQTWSQRVTIPVGNPRFLNFWRNISATPTAGTLKAFVDGDEVYSINVVSEGVDGGFVTVSVDVSDHADGGEHEVKMEYAATGDDGDTFVDDVTLDCEAAPAVEQPVRTALFRGSKHDAPAAAASLWQH